MNKYKLTLFAFFVYNILNAQLISTDDSYTPEQLIGDVLVKECVIVSNIVSKKNGSVNAINSYGYFERVNSNFPFENGIVLSTGSIHSLGNITNPGILNDGTIDWKADTDLEETLGIKDTYNATSIEFDFISSSNLIQFNYILASEEYVGNFPCDFADGFAFLIRKADSNEPYENISLIPDTDIPVNTTTIRREIKGYCGAKNEAYFDGYDVGDTNLNGRTKVLTTAANILPNTLYHIKLVIADQKDPNYDSAVFIEANSLTNSVKLGPDVTTCENSTTITAKSNSPEATYKWYKDDSLILNETSKNLTIKESGIYKVVATSTITKTSVCTSEDTINVVVNATEKITPLTDYTMCDDSSNNGTETFILTQKDEEYINALPKSNYTISYHKNEEDAIKNTNAITTIVNSENPQTIFARATHKVTKCTFLTTFNLIVEPAPTANQPKDQFICKNSSGINLDELNTIVTENEEHLTVSYHQSLEEANNGKNAITSPYMPTNKSEKIVIRVKNTKTNCLNFTSVTLNLESAPQINTEIKPLNACDKDGDGFSTFDLTEVIPQIINNAEPVNISFHKTKNDAENNINSINNINAYTNTTPNSETLYVRVANLSNMCYNIVSIKLYTNILINNTIIKDVTSCSSGLNNDGTSFNLLDIEKEIVNSLDNTIVNFYNTKSDLKNKQNKIDKNVPFIITTNTHTLYIDIIGYDCNYESQMQLIKNPSIVITNNSPYSFCDSDNDGITTINLSDLSKNLGADTKNTKIEYFKTKEDAHNLENKLPKAYKNTSNPQQLFVRVSNTKTECYNIEPITLKILLAPATKTPSDINTCDNGGDGYATVNLESKVSEIVLSQNNTSVTFFKTKNDLEKAANPILNSTEYNTKTTTVFAKATNTDTRCYAIVPLKINVTNKPIITDVSSFQKCNSTNKDIAEFILSKKDNEILNNQAECDVLYFKTYNDAANNTNAINKTKAFKNSSNPQTIYTRLQANNNTACYTIASFNLEVKTLPKYTPPNDVYICSTNEDNVKTYNLNLVANTIKDSSKEKLSVSFYATQHDAEKQTNKLPNVITKTSNPQKIFVSVNNGSFCNSITSYSYHTVKKPIINKIAPISQCDDNYDGITNFNLKNIKVEVKNTDFKNLKINYFKNKEDAENNENEIENSSSYKNTQNPEIIYVKATNTLTGCQTIAPINIIVSLPPKTKDNVIINTCDNESNSFKLKQALPFLTDNPNSASFSFYKTEQDAQLNKNVLGSTYKYTSSNNVIYYRATNNNNCYIVNYFTLKISDSPNLNALKNLEQCSNKKTAIFDLSEQTKTILKNLNANNYNVFYYKNENDAKQNTNAIKKLKHKAKNNETVYVRLENTVSQCFSIGNFNTLINRIPLLEIPDQVICKNNAPLIITANTKDKTDTYLWSTNETTNSIAITKPGTYTVTVTSKKGCSTTEEFTIYESESANIKIIETIEFSDPNKITVSVDGIGDYLYQLDDNQPQESNIFYNAAIGEHTITVIDTNGCGNTTKTILVLDFPDHFSPNGDGYADTFNLANINQFPGSEIKIMDRYGKYITTITNASNGWDGTLNGQRLVSNDYWFSAKIIIKGKTHFVKGHFALRR